MNDSARRARTILVFCRSVALLGVVLAAEAAVALDAVKLKNNIRVTGEIVRYDERGVEIRELTSGRVLTYEAAEIESVDAKLNSYHERGDGALDQLHYIDAVRNYERALQDEKRIWARMQIQGSLVRALQGAGQLEKAGQQFLSIAAGRADADVMVKAPLLWNSGQPIPAGTRDVARSWLARKDLPLAQLLACSWLLETNDRREALPVLKLLQTHHEQRISWLARAQMWRATDKPAKPDEMDRYRDLIERFPESIRGGPQFVLAKAYSDADMFAEAALAYLWVAFVYEAPRDLAAEALLRAARCSQSAGFAEDAQRLYGEVSARYPDTQWSRVAMQELEKSTAPKKQSE